MLRRAIERGVPPERLAAALCVDVSHITKKKLTCWKAYAPRLPSS